MKRLVVAFIAMAITSVTGSAFAADPPAAKSATAAAPASPLYSTSDTPVGDLLDDPKARAILDKYLPNFSTADQIDQARNMTLKAVQAYATDTITDDVLAKIDAEFAKLAAKK